MIETLFVYGTLGPGRPNEHILSKVGGTWKNGSVKGTLREAGWGAELGYPGITLADDGDEITGFVFSSDNLVDHWHNLDEFEGEGYKRVICNVTLENGNTIEANIYTLT